SNWHPVTWLSHMLDITMFHHDAGKHHLHNIILHAVNAVLLFWLLSQITGSMWSSAFVAAVFAWHPLHIESVAWIAERKDVLSTFFWLLSIAGYFYYLRSPRLGRYLLLLLSFALGLMSKPM